jgi:hypothetical protein
MRIVYKNPDDSVCIVTPTPEALGKHLIASIALKDVPEGLPFWIVDDSEIPTDRTFRNAWEVPADWGEPDGYGSEYSTFDAVEAKDVDDQH